MLAQNAAASIGNQVARRIFSRLTGKQGCLPSRQMPSFIENFLTSTEPKDVEITLMQQTFVSIVGL